ncbi:single-stranded DNA-binding protein [Chitinophaga sp.]|uniref:single-stranded DNA-binding protein n=1 Tax=Chitinophaga sp. TaxID=1869181 RepID=UPI0031D8BBD9
MIRLSVIGHLGHDALKKVINGKSVLSFSVAQNEQYRNSNGEVQERTTWINCSVWGRENLAPYLRKGTLVYVEGRPMFKGYAGRQGEVLAGVNMIVMELALLPGARGVLGTGIAGVVADGEEEGSEVQLEEVAAIEVADDKVDHDDMGNGGDKRRGKSGSVRGGKVVSGGSGRNKKEGSEDNVSERNGEEDGVRNDLPF